jgi:hypothetical protein
MEKSLYNNVDGLGVCFFSYSLLKKETVSANVCGHCERGEDIKTFSSRSSSSFFHHSPWLILPKVRGYYLMECGVWRFFLSLPRN